jgi:hypothetical protein
MLSSSPGVDTAWQVVSARAPRGALRRAGAAAERTTRHATSAGALQDAPRELRACAAAERPATAEDVSDCMIADGTAALGGHARADDGRPFFSTLAVRRASANESGDPAGALLCSASAAGSPARALRRGRLGPMHAAVRGAQLLAARLTLRRGACSATRAPPPQQLPPLAATACSALRGGGRTCAPRAALRARRHAPSAASRCAAAMAQAEGQRSASSSAAAPLAALEEQLGGPLGTEPQVRGVRAHRHGAATRACRLRVAPRGS